MNTQWLTSNSDNVSWTVDERYTQGNYCDSDPSRFVFWFLSSFFSSFFLSFFIHTHTHTHIYLGL